MLVGAAGLAYKVISGYRHPSPDAFISVQDQNKLADASAAEHSVEATTASLDVAAATQSTTTVTPTAPSTAATPVEEGAAADVDATCVAIKTEQHEVEGAFRKPHSPEEGRYLQRRLLELAEQSDKLKCV